MVDPRVRSQNEDFIIWVGLVSLVYGVAGGKYDNDFPLSLEEIILLRDKVRDQIDDKYVEKMVLEGIENGKVK